MKRFAHFTFAIALSLTLSLTSLAEETLQQPIDVSVDQPATPQTTHLDSAVKPAGASCGCSGTACRVAPCECSRAKMKIGKRATCVCDPDCYQCESKTKKEDVEKHCYNVCAEPICIPKFRWPWQCCKKSRGSADCTGDDRCCGDGCDDCCDAERCRQQQCGRIRCVNVLEKEKYKCEVCVTNWKAVKKGCGCCNGGPGCGCADCECASGCCADTKKPTPDVLTVSAEEEITQPTAVKQEKTEEDPAAGSKKKSLATKLSNFFKKK